MSNLARGGFAAMFAALALLVGTPRRAGADPNNANCKPNRATCTGNHQVLQRGLHGGVVHGAGEHDDHHEPVHDEHDRDDEHHDDHPALRGQRGRHGH